MSEWDDGYVAAALHDLKKVLLNNNAGKRYGTWGPDHANLAHLSTQLDATQQQAFATALGTKPPRLDLENEAQLKLIWLHEVSLRETNDRAELKRHLSPELVASYLALTFADRAHKALYFWLEEGGEIQGVNWRLPWYYPFWGDAKKWTVSNAQKRFLEAAKHIQQHLKNGRLDARFIVNLGEDFLADFGDSTFLPVTSLHFHHQLSAAIYLMVMKEFEDKGGIPVCGTGKDMRPAITLEMTRTVITLPVERLRYRLRDAMHLRKISQWLLIRLHQYLKGRYLLEDGLACREFSHPHLSPFVFYGKEAIVLLNRRADDEEILRITQEVAGETETPFRVERQLLTLAPRDGRQETRVEPAATLAHRAVGVGYIGCRTETPDGRPETKWAMPGLTVPEVAAHECAVCHKPIAPGQQKTDLEDELCETCYRIRREYWECPKCLALFPRAPACPLCGELGGDLAPRPPSATGKLIRLLDLTGERVAIIAVRIGATPEGMEVESELRLAQFREERLAAEEEVLKSCGLTGQNLQNSLDTAKDRMPLVHGTGGELEYLQAVLEIGRKQEEWQEWLADKIYSGQIGEAAAHFVYRSPALTVILLSETLLRPAYRKITKDLETLHLAHRLDIITCDTHYPLYDALSTLFTGPGRTLETTKRPDEAAAAARKFRGEAGKAYQAWRQSNRQAVPPPNSPVHVSHKELYAAAQAQEMAELDLTYRVLRGGQVREFKGEQARQLLEAEPSRQSAAQLHALALLAEQLGALAPEGNEGTRETLLMDLDGRARYIEDDMRELVADIIRNRTPLEAAQHLRELARATRP